MWLPGGWWLFPSDEHPLQAYQPGTGRGFEVSGELADALLSGELSARGLSVMRRLRPELDALVSAVETHGPPTALTRDVMLRGDGFDRLFVELTARCNEACVHCYAESSPQRTEALTWEQLRGVIEDGADLGFAGLQLTGGDPLIHKDVVAAVTLGRECGYGQVEIYTNGLALTQSLYDTLRPHAPDYAFSFYSHDEGSHDRITRTPGSWRRTTQAIRRAIEGGSNVRIGMVVTPLNAGHVSETRALLGQLGVRPERISVDASRAVGRGSAELELLDGAAGPSSEHGSRQRFFGRIAVSYDGRVYPCIFSRAFVLGDIRQRRLASIVNDRQPVGPCATNAVARSSRWARSLSCWQCQLRAELLRGGASSTPFGDMAA